MQIETGPLLVGEEGWHNESEPGYYLSFQDAANLGTLLMLSEVPLIDRNGTPIPPEAQEQIEQGFRWFAQDMLASTVRKMPNLLVQHLQVPKNVVPLTPLRLAVQAFCTLEGRFAVPAVHVRVGKQWIAYRHGAYVAGTALTRDAAEAALDDTWVTLMANALESYEMIRKAEGEADGT
jgi:hypothetical protein